MEYVINPFIWCAVGAAIGWLFSRMASASTHTSTVENVLVGMFGAFIGGDFVAAQFNNGVVNNTQFTLSALLLSIAGAVVILLLLKLMRRIVGPMRNSKATSRKRDY